jgi:hypothetical protein
MERWLANKVRFPVRKVFPVGIFRNGRHHHCLDAAIVIGGPVPQTSQKAPQPPGPPEFGREFELKTIQAVGVSLLAILVLLALLGVFGHSRGEASGQGEVLALQVTYPSRFRFKTVDALEVQVRNVAGEALQTVNVRFDRSYVDSFSGVQFTPSVSTISEDAYEVTLSDLRPGEVNVVSVAVQAEQYWRHQGFVEAQAGSATTRAEVSTLVYP